MIFTGYFSYIFIPHHGKTYLLKLLKKNNLFLQEKNTLTLIFNLVDLLSSFSKILIWHKWKKYRIQEYI